MKPIRVCAGLCFALLSGQALAVAGDAVFPGVRQARMAELDFMVGIWELTSRESVAKGPATERAGMRSCVWVLNKTAIRCDDRISDSAIGPVSSDNPEIKERVFYVTYNESEESYEILYMDALSSQRSVYAANFDPQSQSLLKVSGDGQSGDTSPIVSAVQTRVDDNQIREQLEWVSAGSQQIESVETVLHRKVGNPGDDLFF